MTMIKNKKPKCPTNKIIGTQDYIADELNISFWKHGYPQILYHIYTQNDILLQQFN